MLLRSEDMKICQCGCAEFLRKEEDIQYSSKSREKEIVKEMVHTCLGCGERYIKMGENHDIEIKYKKATE